MVFRSFRRSQLQAVLLTLETAIHKVSFIKLRRIIMGSIFRLFALSILRKLANLRLAAQDAASLMLARSNYPLANSSE